MYLHKKISQGKFNLASIPDSSLGLGSNFYINLSFLVSFFYEFFGRSACTFR